MQANQHKASHKGGYDHIRTVNRPADHQCLCFLPIFLFLILGCLQCDQQEGSILNLRHVQPTAVFGSVVKRKAIGQAAGLFLLVHSPVP